MRTRAGYAFAELVVTLALAGLVSAAVCSVLLTHLRMARIIAARVAAADATRLALYVLPAELRLGSAPADIHGLGPDSLSARLPRASGTVCAHAPGRLWLRARGMREPDPDKDSILVVWADGERSVGAGGAVPEPSGCPVQPGMTTYRVDSDLDLEDGGVAVLFESGTYYLRERAFRYRVGGEGRQPLTDEIIGEDSGLALRQRAGSAVLEIRVAVRPAFGVDLARPARSAFTLANMDAVPAAGVVPGP